MMHTEKVFDDLASTCPNDCLIICDRGSMDPSAYIEQHLWRGFANIGVLPALHTFFFTVFSNATISTKLIYATIDTIKLCTW
jgi:hypothetical protein